MRVAFVWSRSDFENRKKRVEHHMRVLSRFDFENRKTRVEQEMPIVAALMKLLEDEAVKDADELYV